MQVLACGRLAIERLDVRDLAGRVEFELVVPVLRSLAPGGEYSVTDPATVLLAVEYADRRVLVAQRLVDHQWIECASVALGALTEDLARTVELEAGIPRSRRDKEGAVRGRDEVQLAGRTEALVGLQVVEVDDPAQVEGDVARAGGSAEERARPAR